MVSGDRGDERWPGALPCTFGQEEAVGRGIEEAHSPGSVIKSGSHPGGVVIEALWVMGWHLSLELLGELADVVQAEEVPKERCRFFERQLHQAGKVLAEPGLRCQQGFAGRSHVERMVRERMPLRTAVRVERLGLAPEANHVHR